MCIEDFRLGRQTYSNIVTKAIGSTWTELLPASLNRTNIVFGSSITDPYYLTTNPNIGAEGEIVIPVNCPPFKLNIQDEGAIVRMPWYGISPSAVVMVGIIETALDAK